MSVAIIICVRCLRPLPRAKRGASRANLISSPGHLLWVGHRRRDLSHRPGDRGRSERVWVFVVPMSEEFGWSRSTISLAAALGFLVNGLSQPFVGQLFDTLEGRKVILASLATFGITTVLLATTFHIALPHRGLRGAHVDRLERDLRRPPVPCCPAGFSAGAPPC